MLKAFGAFLQDYQHYRPAAAIDKAHVSLIFSTAISQKPESILELGIGTGLVTYALKHATIYNLKGQITSVDSWVDWDGIEPPEIDNLRKNNINVIFSEEEKFVANCKDKYDLIVVDGDHTNGHKWAESIFDLLNPGGIMFSHDINLFPNLKVYKEIADKRGYAYHLFDKSSRSDERCDRGFIIVYAK